MLVTYSIDLNILRRFKTKFSTEEAKRKKTRIIEQLMNEVLKGNILVDFENDEIKIKYPIVPVS